MKSSHTHPLTNMPSAQEKNRFGSNAIFGHEPMCIGNFHGNVSFFSLKDIRGPEEAIVANAKPNGAQLRSLCFPSPDHDNPPYFSINASCPWGYMKEKAKARLRELAPMAIGSQKAGFTQLYFFLHFCTQLEITEAAVCSYPIRSLLYCKPKSILLYDAARCCCR